MSELTQSDLLNSFKKKYIDNSGPAVNVNPGVSKQLIHWLETQEFPREKFMANDPLLSQKLMIREGIEMVLSVLNNEYNKQERIIAESHGESSITQPR